MGGVSDNNGIRIIRLTESLGQAFYFCVFQYVGIIFLKIFQNEGLFRLPPEVYRATGDKSRCLKKGRHNEKR